MGNYVMGLDAGSSKSHLALFDLAGKRIDFLEWGPLNHEVIDGGYAQLERELHALLDMARDRNGLSAEALERGVFGMAGADTLRQHAQIRGILSRCGIKDPVLCNDAFLPIKATCRSGYGICVINGSGSTAAGIGMDGGMLQVGGCGRLTGDIGGGGYLGQAAVRAVYTSLFKGAVPTLLTERLLERLNITRGEDLLDALAAEEEDGSIVLSDLNRMLFDAANDCDEVSQALLTSAGADSGKAVCGILERLSFPEGEAVEVALAGSVIVKGSHPALVNGLKREVLSGAGSREVKFIMTDKPPVMGAIVWALDRHMSADVAIDRVRKQL